MLRTLTINLIKCRRIKFAESFFSKYKYSSVSGIRQSKNISPNTRVNGQYLTKNTNSKFKKSFKTTNYIGSFIIFY